MYQLRAMSTFYLSQSLEVKISELSRSYSSGSSLRLLSSICQGHSQQKALRGTRHSNTFLFSQPLGSLRDATEPDPASKIHRSGCGSTCL